MIKVKDNNISLSGSRIELATDIAAIMIAYINSDPIDPEAAAALLFGCLTRAVEIVKSPNFETRTIDKNIVEIVKSPNFETRTIDKNIIDQAFEEINNEQEAEE